VSGALRQAVVLSGGGASGAYEVGVLKALAAGGGPPSGLRPFEPEIVTGTSIGAFNAAFLVSRWRQPAAAAIADLERVWLSVLAGDCWGAGNGAFRFRGDPRGWLDPRFAAGDPLGLAGRTLADGAALAADGLARGLALLGSREPLGERLFDLPSLAVLVSREPFEATISREIRFAEIHRSPKALRIAATNWATGALRLFANRDLTPDLGPRAILASSAIPGFFAPEEIDGEPHVDGGVLMNTPLKPAIEAGGEALHVVYLDPDVANIPLREAQGILGALYRMQAIGWAAVVNDDVEDARAINRGLALEVKRAEGRGLAGREGGDWLKVAARLDDRHAASRPYRPLTIHRYHPRDDPGGAAGALDLGRERIRRLIRQGFEETLAHHCGAAGCVLA
jgi:NTE family protein